jgi:hypothetical protein
VSPFGVLGLRQRAATGNICASARWTAAGSVSRRRFLFGGIPRRSQHNAVDNGQQIPNPSMVENQASRLIQELAIVIRNMEGELEKTISDASNLRARNDNLATENKSLRNSEQQSQQLIRDLKHALREIIEEFEGVVFDEFSRMPDLIAQSKMLVGDDF